ncbi:MAG: hypothetical protein SPJ68_05405 [Arcanobacterium sp.]|nr:hypothetical protein [Arcanobacterium sp.]
MFFLLLVVVGVFTSDGLAFLGLAGMIQMLAIRFEACVVGDDRG